MMVELPDRKRDDEYYREPIPDDMYKTAPLKDMVAYLGWKINRLSSKLFNNGYILPSIVK